MVRSDAPVWDSRGIRSSFEPILRHRRAQQNIINPAVHVVLAVKISPRHVARLVVWRFRRHIVAIALGRTGVHQLEFAASNDFAERIGILFIVEIAKYDQSRIRIGLEMVIDDLPQNFGLFITLLIGILRRNQAPWISNARQSA
jgi:hypothetical protein